MQVYTKYYSENKQTNWNTVHKPFIRYMPFTKNSGLSYKIGEFKQDPIEVYIEDVVFATIQSEHAERFVNYFLGQAHNALNINDGTFIVYDGEELVDKYFKEAVRKHEWFK